MMLELLSITTGVGDLSRPREISAARWHVVRALRPGLFLAMALLMGTDAPAQELKSADWRRGTTLAGFVGAATGSETGAATGAALGWELLPHLTIDGSGIWSMPHRDASTFTGLLGVRVNLTRPQGVVPFASGGVGLHRAMFDSVTSNVPDFYRRRMTASSTGLRTQYAFDDFAYAAGVGVDMFLRRHLALRPDVRFVFITNGGDTRTVAMYGLHLAYHFEEHPITP
jgi:hypothetical protein